MITLELFPLPPSENGLYPTIFIGGRVRRVQSAALKSFLKEVEAWHWSNQRVIASAVSEFKMATQDIMTDISVSIELRLKRERLITKKNTRKVFDVSNRIKAVHDSLSSLLSIDDHRFVCGDVFPTIIAEGKECLKIVLTLRKIKTVGMIEGF